MLKRLRELAARLPKGALATVLTLLALVGAVSRSHAPLHPGPLPPTPSFHRLGALATTAKFKVNGTASSPPGFDATNGQTITLQLETAVAPDVYKAQFFINDPNDPSSPQASLSAPTVTLSPSSGIPTTPTGTVTFTMPASGYHTYAIRCVLNGGTEVATGRVRPEWTFERIVAIRSGTNIRKLLPGETTQYSSRGWSDEQNLMVDNLSGGGGGGGSACQVADAATLRGIIAANRTDNELCTVGSLNANVQFSATSGAGFADDNATIFKPTDVLVGNAGRWYIQTGAAVVPTRAALLAAVSGKQSKVETQAYRTLGDGGGLIFDYDPNDSTSTDDGGYLALAGTKRFKARRAGPALAQHYGMVGDCFAATDGNISAASTTLTSATTTFVQGQTVIVIGAKFYPLSGTVTTTNGSRAVVGSGTKFEDELWEGATPITFVGQAGTYTATTELTGTLAYGSANAHWVGTGTKWTTELHAGAIVRARGGANGSGPNHPLAFMRQVLGSPSITDTTLDVNAVAPDRASAYASVSGAKMRWQWRGDSTDLGGGVRAAQARVLVTPAPAFSVGGLTMRGPPQRLITTVSSVSGGGHTATLATAADVAVTNGLIFTGTDNSTAFANLLANNDHVHIAADPHGIQSTTSPRLACTKGSYILASGPTIPGTHAGAQLSFSSGAQLVIGDTFTINAPAVTVMAPSMGIAVGGGGQSTAYNFDPHIKYAGPFRKGIVQIQDGSYSTSAGTGIEGLRVQQVVDVTTDNNDLSFPGTGGVIGFEIGSRPNNGATDDAFQLEKITSIDCEDGVLANGGTQSYVLRDININRYNSGQDPTFTQPGTRTGTCTLGETLTQATTGYTATETASTSVLLTFSSASQLFDATHTITGGSSGCTFAPSAVPDYFRGPFSNGFGIGIGVTSYYHAASAVCTAGRIEGQTLLHNARTGIQIGNPYAGAQVATTDVGGQITIEGMHPIDQAYFRVHAAGRVDISGVHAENTASVDRFSSVGFEVGTPATNGAAFQFSAHQNRLATAGGGISIAAYQWGGFDISDNLLDAQDVVANHAMYFADLSGGFGLRRNGHWGPQLDYGAGPNNDPLEIWPNGDQPATLSGITDARVYNIDAAGTSHLFGYSSGRSSFDSMTCPYFTGTKTMFGATQMLGVVTIGDEATTTTTTGSQASGQKVVVVASTTGLLPGENIEINPGGGDDEFVVIDTVTDATHLLMATNLVNTHANGETIIPAGSSFTAKGAITLVGGSNGVPVTVTLDGAPLQIANKVTATSGHPNVLNSELIFSSYWDGATSHGATISMGPPVIDNPGSHLHHWTLAYEGNNALSIDQAGVVHIGGGTGCAVRSGSGSPNSVVVGSPCDFYLNTAGGANTTIYVKESGSATNTGWVAK